MGNNYIKEYQDRCDHEWIHTLDDMGYSVDICNECGAWKHYDKKTKEQVDKDFEEILAMSKTGQITISTREFSELVNAVERVRELHKQIDDYCGYCADIGSCCNPKDFEYPCSTIKALDGEQ